MIKIRFVQSKVLTFNPKHKTNQILWVSNKLKYLRGNFLRIIHLERVKEHILLKIM